MELPLIGQIELICHQEVPDGWLPCDGRLLPIAQHQALFSILGTIYGGDGRTTFALPDLRGRLPIGAGQGPGLSPHMLGSTGGTYSVTLQQMELPVHAHPIAPEKTRFNLIISVEGGPGDSPNPANNHLAYTSQNMYTLDGSGADQEANRTPLNYQIDQVDIHLAGASQPHENRQPYIAMQYVIAILGIYPQRN